MTAFEKHGFFKGFALSFYRLLRCNPWSMGGIDYVPGTEDYYRIRYEKRNKTPKNKTTIDSDKE